MRTKEELRALLFEHNRLCKDLADDAEFSQDIELILEFLISNGALNMQQNALIMLIENTNLISVIDEDNEQPRSTVTEAKRNDTHEAQIKRRSRPFKFRMKQNPQTISHVHVHNNQNHAQSESTLKDFIGTRGSWIPSGKSVAIFVVSLLIGSGMGQSFAEDECAAQKAAEEKASSKKNQSNPPKKAIKSED